MPTGQASSSTYDFQLIVDAALADYAKITGKDLSKDPFADLLEKSKTPDAILELLQEREKAFGEYRRGNRKLIKCLSPLVKVLHAFSGVLSEAADLVSVTYHPVNLLTWPRQIPFSPAKAVFTSIDVLLTVRLFNILFNRPPVT
jgi:hypothetical protein